MYKVDNRKLIGWLPYLLVHAVHSGWFFSPFPTEKETKVIKIQNHRYTQTKNQSKIIIAYLPSFLVVKLIFTKEGEEFPKNLNFRPNSHNGSDAVGHQIVRRLLLNHTVSIHTIRVRVSENWMRFEARLFIQAIAAWIWIPPAHYEKIRPRCQESRCDWLAMTQAHDVTY